MIPVSKDKNFKILTRSKAILLQRAAGCFSAIIKNKGAAPVDVIVEMRMLLQEIETHPEVGVGPKKSKTVKEFLEKQRLFLEKNPAFAKADSEYDANHPEEASVQLPDEVL